MTSSRLPALVTALAAAIGFAACLAGWLVGGGSVDLAWAPSLDMRIELAYDGLGALYALLATGIGFAVFVYGIAYLPWHLKKAGRSVADARRFWPWLALFMVSMVGLACSRDLILLFVFFDLTAVASYFLIGFDRERREARGAALMALLVTGGSAVCLLVGAVLLQAEYGTFSLPELFAVAEPTTTTVLATALIALAALAKSAQVPLHFWLPRAMEAPTPVSAYLHSAAMVAAGVLVLGRIHPLISLSDVLLDSLFWVGVASILVGGLLALAQNDLKQILAHSTISQYGYVVVCYGIGGSSGAGAAALYVITHAIAKSALFMTAGAVLVATSESTLGRVGGLARRMPLLATASGVAAATLAALPLTLGFFKDELFFYAALDAGPVAVVVSVLAAALTFAYIGRFWLGTFAGRPRAHLSVARISPLLVWPVAALAAIAVLGGVAVGPFASLAADAAAVTHAAPVDLSPAYYLDLRDANVMAIAAWVLGVVLILAVRVRAPIAAAFDRAGAAFGPRRAYALGLRGVNTLSDRIHDAEVRDLRNSVAAVLIPTAVLVAIAFAVTPFENAYVVGDVVAGDLPIVVLLVLAVAASLAAMLDPSRLRPVLALSVVGFALAAVYAIVGAPDVALVAVLVETVFTLLFVGVFSRLPASRAPSPGGPRKRRNAIAGVLAGAAAFVTIWGALSRSSQGPGVSAELIELTPGAHGGDVVTVILADFRGLDTMVEITVLAVAMVGVASLLSRRGRAW